MLNIIDVTRAGRADPTLRKDRRSAARTEDAIISNLGLSWFSESDTQRRDVIELVTADNDLLGRSDLNM